MAESRRDRRSPAGPGLRRRLGSVLATVTLVSVLLLGVVNYFEARSLLENEVGTALEARGSALGREIRSALRAIENTASLVASGPGMATYLEAFESAFVALEDLPDLVTPEEREVVESFYQANVIDPIAEAGLAPPELADVVPTSDAGIYLQYHYVVNNPYPAGEREALVESQTDHSVYAAVHSELHPRLDRLRSTLGFAGVMLIDLDGTVVYATDKRIDLGTDLRSGPYRNTALATIVTERLATAPTGDAVFADFEFYVPEGSKPTMFAVVAVQMDGAFSGAVAFEIPVDALNRVTTADGRWEDVGLGSTGEVYIVGPDQRMRSESRRWIEDSADYVATLELNESSRDLAATMMALDTNVLLQPVESAAVLEALDGIATTARTADYLGRRSLTYAAPIGAEGLGWVIVAQVSDDEAGSSLRAFRTRILVTAALLLPIAILVGFVLADRISRRLTPVVDAATSIANGNLEVAMPDLGKNEFGDVARRLGDMAAHLRAQAQKLEDEEAEVKRMMLAALPPRLVERLRSGERRIEDLVDTATVISVTISGVFDAAAVDSDTAGELGARISLALETEAAAREIERVRSSSVHHLFVAGLGRPEPDGEAAVEFAVAARLAAAAEGEVHGVPVGFRAGLASGRIVSSLLSGNQLSYGVFGEAVQLALTLDASGSLGDIVVHDSVTSILPDRWRLEPARDLFDVSGAVINASLLVNQEELQSPAD